MKRIQIPETELTTSRLGLGTGALHHLPTESQRQTLLRAAIDAGITHFDTAPMYGEGLAERSLGHMFRGATTDDLTVATKIGFPCRLFAGAVPWLMYADKAIGVAARRFGFMRQRPRLRDLSPRGVEKSVNQSLRRLSISRIHLLLVHEPDSREADAIRRLLPLFDRLKQSGAIGAVGMAGGARTCAAIANLLPEAFDVLQVEDSVDGCEADFVTQAGRPLQITYGYLRLAAARADGSRLTPATAGDVLAVALRRNPKGMVLVSSRKPDRVSALAEGCRRLDQ